MFQLPQLMVVKMGYFLKAPDVIWRLRCLEFHIYNLIVYGLRMVALTFNCPVGGLFFLH